MTPLVYGPVMSSIAALSEKPSSTLACVPRNDPRMMVGCGPPALGLAGPGGLTGEVLARAVVEGSGWERLVAGWLASYDSPHTRAAYARDLAGLASWSTSVGVQLLELGVAELAAWKAVQVDAGVGAATIARRLAAVSAFFRFLRSEGVTERNPVEFVRRPRVGRQPGSPALSGVQAGRLLDVAEATGPRDMVLVCLLLLNGLRVSEACGADVEGLVDTHGHHTLRIVRKGGLVVRVPLAPRTWAAVTALLVERGRPTVGALLVDGTGERLDRHDAARALRRLCRRASVLVISPHGLRHTFVTTARAAGIDLRDVQHAAGHADPRTTMAYDHTADDLDRHPTYVLATHLRTRL